MAKTIVVKQIGSPIRRPADQRATLDGLKKEASPRMVAQRRGKKVADILPKRDEAPAAAPATEEA